MTAVGLATTRPPAAPPCPSGHKTGTRTFATVRLKGRETARHFCTRCGRRWDTEVVARS